MKDYYKILGVSEDVTDEELKKAYRRLSMKYHPDKQGGKSDKEKKEAEEKFKEIAEAYSVLSDPQKKQEWQMGGQSFNFSEGDPFDIFSNFFYRTPQQPKGQSLRIAITISIKEALFGTKKTIKYRRKIICPNCSGKGTSKNSKIEICNTCHGRGQIYKQVGPWQQIIDCPNCLGKGKIIKNPCPKCHGEGLIEAEESIEINIPKLNEPIQLPLLEKVQNVLMVLMVIYLL